MRTLNLLALALLFSTPLMAQDYLDKIAQQACDCLYKVSDTLPEDRFNLELGLCIINASTPYSKQLKKDHGIKIENIDTEGEKLGRLIGVRMAGICSERLLKVASRTSGDSEIPPPPPLGEYIGNITRIETEFFVVFSVKDESGKTSRFLWLTNIETKSDLVSQYQMLTGKEVKIGYEIQDIFDPKIGEYRRFNVIRSLEIAK